MMRVAAFAAILVLSPAHVVADRETTTYAYLGGFEHEVIYLKQSPDWESAKIGYGDSLGPAELCAPTRLGTSP